jgi:capsule biosynthesis phosphatase
MMKRLVVDLDGTITVDNPNVSYIDRIPNSELVTRLREYKELGFEIVVYSARNMKTYDNSVGKINAHTLPLIVDWLKRHEVPFDEIHVGKPWCGDEGFYIDDRAIRPSEFTALTFEQIKKLVG